MNAAIIKLAESRRAEFLLKTLNSLQSQIAVQGADGTILAVNASWKAIASKNGLAQQCCGPGVNYQRNAQAPLQPLQAIEGHAAPVFEQPDHAGDCRVVFPLARFVPEGHQRNFDSESRFWQSQKP